MRILILANNDIGLYKFRKELLERFISDKNDVYISLPYGSCIKALQLLGCNYIKTEFERRGVNPFEDMILLTKYVSIIRDVNPDVILTYTIKPTIYGGMACIVKRKKYIVNITGLGTAVENRGFFQKIILKMYKVALSKASCVFFQNESNLNFFAKEKLIKSRTRLITGSGVNIDDYAFEKYPVTEHFTDMFLFIGRIMKDKGIEEFVEAATKIKKKYPRVTFEIVGGMDEDYFPLIEEKKNQGIIKYWDQQLDVKPFIKRCNAVVLPSYHEGMSNVLLEASSMGRPVLASNIPGCVETFDEGISGLGFRSRDADDLYNKLEHFILMENNKKIEMGKAARKKIEKYFNRQQVIEAYIDEVKNLEVADNVNL